MMQSTQTQNREVIRRYLMESLRLRHTLADDEELLLSGLLDSLSAIRFVSMLETEFDFTIPPEDVTVTNLSSIDTVMAYLARRDL